MDSSLASSSPTKTTPLSPTSPGGDTKNVQDLTAFVETLLGNMQEKFQTMSDNILTRMDEMGNRIDDLEKNITDLMHQAGIEDDVVAEK